MLSEITSSIASFIIESVKNPILIIILLTIIPFLELRASIPYGILIAKMHWFPVLILAALSNIIIAPITYFCLDKLIHSLFFIKSFERWYHNKLEKSQKKLKPYIDKYGLIGIALFIAVPLPGTGVYTGTLASYGLNLGYKKTIYATIIGVIIAGIIVTIISISFGIAGNIISKLFLNI